ncbi:hypothetical protein BJX99DRAFT_46479 [Aspergillus californicus]
MLFASLFIGTASIAAQVSGVTDAERTQQRDVASQAPSLTRSILGMQKMSDDEGEKFLMDYWHYEDDNVVANSTAVDDNNAHTETDRSTVLPRSYPLQPPFGLGLERFSSLRLSPLFRRDFECPTGTYGCTSIDEPDSCCRTDETCVVVEDTGSGDVGCCPAGQDCSGTIGSCWEGYTSCSSSLGGGCCFPGYSCVDDGCARVVTITITLSSTTLTTTSTETVPATTSTTTTPTSTSSTTSTGDLSPPDRPTSLSTTTSSESTTSSETETSCPTGFYACAAFYQGGCCRTGRDCDTTSCPTMASTTIVSNDRTIVIPVETTSAASSDESSEESTTGRCATGWFSCADTVGGGCCPSGYACGSSCTAVPTASTTGTVAKEEPTETSAARKEAKIGRATLICAGFMSWMALLA